MWECRVPDMGGVLSWANVIAMEHGCFLPPGAAAFLSSLAAAAEPLGRTVVSSWGQGVPVAGYGATVSTVFPPGLT